MSKSDNDSDIPVHWLVASMIPALRLHVYLPIADAVSACRMSHVACRVSRVRRERNSKGTAHDGLRRQIVRKASEHGRREGGILQ
jgi:hypothetical protein